MIIVGQMNLIYLFEKRHTKLLYKHFVWLTEHIGNQTVPGIPVKNFDAALYAMPEEKIGQMTPELLITYGGHVVSKRLKNIFGSIRLKNIGMCLLMEKWLTFTVL